MLSETEELLQPIPLTDHAQYCQYPCYCMAGTEAQLAYQENLRKRMTAGQIEPAKRPRYRWFVGKREI